MILFSMEKKCSGGGKLCEGDPKTVGDCNKSRLVSFLYVFGVCNVEFCGFVCAFHLHCIELSKVNG